MFDLKKEWEWKWLSHRKGHCLIKEKTWGGGEEMADGGAKTSFGGNRRISLAMVPSPQKWVGFLSHSLCFCTLLFGIVFQFACTIRFNCLAHLLTSMKQNVIVFPFIPWISLEMTTSVRNFCTHVSKVTFWGRDSRPENLNLNQHIPFKYWA